MFRVCWSWSRAFDNGGNSVAGILIDLIAESSSMLPRCDFGVVEKG